MDKEKQIKRLPRNDNDELLDSFMANGTKYLIRSSDQVLGIKRANMIAKLQPLIAWNLADFKQIDLKIQEMIEHLNQALIGDKTAIARLAADLFTFRDSVQEFAKDNYTVEQLICTVFVVKEGEDLTNFDMEEAKKKLADWEKEGYNASDFLSLAIAFSKDLKDVVLERLKRGKNV